MLKTSLAKVRIRTSPNLSGAKPIMPIAFAIMVGRSVKSVIVSEKALIFSYSAGEQVSAGIIRI